MKKISSILLVILLLMNFWALFFSPVVSEGEHDREDEVVIGEIETDSLPKIFTFPYAIQDARFPSDDSYLAVSIHQNTGSDGNISIINTTDFSFITNLTVPNSEFQFMDISDDDTYLAVASYDLSMAHVFWTSNWTFKQNLTDMTDAGHNVDFSPNGNWLAVVGSDQYIYIYDVPSFTLNTSWDTAQWPSYNTLWFSPDSQYLAHSEFSSADTVIYWTANWTEKTRFDPRGSGITSTSKWSNNGTWLVVNDYDTSINDPILAVYRTSDFTEIANWTLHVGNPDPGVPQIDSIDFSPDDKFMFVSLYATTEDDIIISVVNTSNWETVATWTDIGGGTAGRAQELSYNNQFLTSNYFVGVNDRKLRFRSIFNVTRDSDISPPVGDVTESETFEFTAQRPYTGNVTLKIPISSSVTGIINVRNETTGTEATSVEVKANLVNNTYYFDSANNYVYIETIDLSVGSLVNWTVNCSYGMTFSLTLPTYLEVGDYFIATGLIKNATGVPVDGVLAKMRVLYSNGTDALAVPPEWNCTNGNYYCVFSTSSLLPGIYSISIEFTEDNITYKEGSILYLSYDTPTGVYSDALVFFNFYNTNEGLGLPTETLKVYVDAVRQYETTYYAYTNQEINITIKDYYNTTLYSDNHTIINTYTFLDFGLTFHSYKFCNKNDRYYMISLLKAGSSRWYERAVCPYETIEYVLPTGNYTLRIYNHTGAEIYNSTLPPSIVVNQSIVYEIHGTNLSEILSGQSTIVGEILETRNETYNINDTVNYFNETIPDLLNRSIVVFSFYNTNHGLGLDRETLLVYIDGSRLIGNVYYCTNGTTINVTVKDFYNFTLYQNDFTVDEPFEFIDLGLTFHSWLFGNKNDDYYMVSLLKDGASRWWERGIIPYGEREFLIPSANYTMRIYDKNYVELINQTYVINNSRVFVIHGTNLSEIISGLSVVRGQLLEVFATLDYALTPDVEIISCNPPMIRSCFEKKGIPLGDNVWVVDPIYNIQATTRQETFGNYINSTALIPGNGSVANGTITILEDTMYISGNGSVSWVNITYTDNGTLYQNTTYIPSKLNLYGQNLTINASCDINIQRETDYNQMKHFGWVVYGDTGEHRYTIDVENPFNNASIYDVYVYVAFSNESTPDENTVQIIDIANGNLELTRDEHFKTGGSGIEFFILSIPVNGTREFALSYYWSDYSQLNYDTDIIYVDDYKTKQSVTFDDKFYNSFTRTWVNDESTTFRGEIIIALDFAKSNEIEPTSIHIWDAKNSRYLNRSMFFYGTGSIMISSEAIGDVSPGGGNEFTVYFRFMEYPGADPTEWHLNSIITYLGPIPITTYSIIFVMAIVTLGIGIISIILSETKKNTWKGKLLIGIGAFVLFVFYILQAQGI